MDSHLIDVLSTLDPSSPLPRVTLATLSGSKRRWSPLHDDAKDRFLAKYVRTNFGWYIAKQFANHRKPFPVPMMGRDYWVVRAYMLLLDDHEYYDRHIVEAFHLHHYVQNKADLGQYLRALLLSYDTDLTPEEHIDRVAHKTQVPYGTIDAFEALFYNVLDRIGDSLYLAREVYPETRAIEFDENYLRNSKNADLIKRAGYNHRDLDLTAYLSGLGDHSYLKKLAADDNREAELTRCLMGNGLILAHSNLLNQRSVGVSRVSHLLAASRQSGKEMHEDEVGGIAPLLTGAFKQATQINHQRVVQQMRLDAGQEDLTTLEV